MISPRVDRLLENVDSPYASVIVAAKRARQINSYYHNLGEGTFEEFPPPMVDTGSKNYLTIALEEVAGPTKRWAASVWITRTAWPALSRSRVSSTAL